MNRTSNPSCNCSIAVVKYLISTIAAVLLVANVDAQRVTLEADTTTLELGGQTWIHLSAQRDPASSSATYAWPAWEDTLPGGWEILELRPLDTSLVQWEDGRDAIAVTQSMRVTTWDTGVVRMPELPLTLGADTFISNAMLFVVHAPQLGEEGQIADFAEVIDVQWTLWERLQRALPYLLAALLLVAVVACGYVVYRRRAQRMRASDSMDPELPKEPADVIALRTLRRVQEQAAWKRGDFKGHHAQISTALRTYLEQQFGFAALELTTAEIRRGVASTGVDAEQQRNLLAILELSDLVKFAKYQGGAEEHERAVRRAIEFVERTCSREEILEA